jgi:hypothetical protein
MMSNGPVSPANSSGLGDSVGWSARLGMTPPSWDRV